MDSRMTIEERQAFLAETWVGILSIAQEGRGPLSVPVWYNYQPGGEVCIWTGANTRKAKLLQSTKRISFCVQDPTAPNYKYVSVEGPFTIQPVNPERDIRPMAIRYFGPKGGEDYYQDVTQSDNWKNDILIRILPERWLTADFGKLMPENK
jgi:general stress protein 26